VAVDLGSVGRFFAELGCAQDDPGLKRARLRALGIEYGVEFDTESVSLLCAEHWLAHPSLPD